MVKQQLGDLELVRKQAAGRQVRFLVGCTMNMLPSRLHQLPHTWCNNSFVTWGSQNNRQQADRYDWWAVREHVTQQAAPAALHMVKQQLSNLE
jgi:hypothetical protein